MCFQVCQNMSLSYIAFFTIECLVDLSVKLLCERLYSKTKENEVILKCPIKYCEVLNQINFLVINQHSGLKGYESYFVVKYHCYYSFQQFT